MKKLKKHLLTIIIVLVFLIGLSVLLYPTVSDYFNKRNQSRVVASYREAVERMDPRDIEGMFAEAHEYNERLRLRPNRFELSDEEYEEYYNLLNVGIGATGIMGALDISYLNIMLPIYHGTGEAVLQIALGHFEGTSLPVGGLGTHTVITGHRGLPSALLLTEIDRMVIGDVFMIHVLNETLTYQVDQIVIVEPGDFSELAIDPNMDYATLLTCTPYGINSHRLLVRGHRIENEEAEVAIRRLVMLSEARQISTIHALAIFLVPVLAVVIIVKVVLNIRKSRKRGLPK